MKFTQILIFIVITGALTGCAASPSYVPETGPLEPGRLPTPNINLSVSNLRSCTDSPDSTLRLNSDYPVTVLVHGCNGSAGRFRSLAQLYAFHGQQAVCFSYDDRKSLVTVSQELVESLDTLSGKLRDHKLTVIGHSMGGLVARKAMERERADDWKQNEAEIKLVTVSAPLAGIYAANTCGNRLLHWATLGIVPGICWAITGDNWYEISPPSNFIRQPGPLISSVQQYVKIVTDERDTCRQTNADGSCVKSDYVFSLAEQYNPVIDNYPNLVNVEVDAGHVEIVGNKEVAPRKLLSILQRQGLLAPTPPERRAALELLLTELY